MRSVQKTIPKKSAHSQREDTEDGRKKDDRREFNEVPSLALM